MTGVAFEDEPIPAKMDVETAQSLFPDMMPEEKVAMEDEPREGVQHPDQDDEVQFMSFKCMCSWCVPMIDVEEKDEVTDKTINKLPSPAIGGQKRETTAALQELGMKGDGKGKLGKGQGEWHGATTIRKEQD